MSECIDIRDSHAAIRWKLLTGVSALALTAYVSSIGIANAEDSDRPPLWIELGGQMETPQGGTAPFTAPFMLLTPVPDVYHGVPLIGDQKQPRFSFGEEGKISFQPDNSDWIFSAGIRYGRSHANRHSHNQIAHPDVNWGYTYAGHYYGHYATFANANALADSKTENSESHAILDFTAGKDVGLGFLGRGGSSNINAGVRIAAFTSHLSANISARPQINLAYESKYGGLIRIPKPTFYQYTMIGHATRSFKGIGPSLSWNASAALLGDKEDGQVTLDWGINAALLFGKQKAKTDHSTFATHYNLVGKYVQYTGTAYPPRAAHSTRSRSVTVTNIGGFAGLSVKYPNVKVSVGYRYDTFLNAMDTGIDVAKKSNVTFNGPFASVSVGIGD